MAGGSPPQCQLTVEDVFWNATVLHRAELTQPSQSALSKQSVHTEKINTMQDISVYVRIVVSVNVIDNVSKALGTG